MIRVSDLTAYLKCPRLAYFLNKGHELLKNKDAGYIERLILKELALTYASVEKDSLSILNGLNCELDRILEEVRVIYRPELEGVEDETLAKAAAGVRSCLENIASNLPSSLDFYASTDIEYEPLLQSEKFGLTGSPDKLVKINDEFFPSIIKTGSMPENGVWHGDRMQLTAYAMLVEEKHKSVVNKGFVEYARWGKVREVTIKRHERRKVFQLRDKIKKIQDGIMPEKPGDAPCEPCGFKEMCEVKPTLASRFF